MSWPPVVHLNNPIDQQVYRALFDGNFSELLRLDKECIDWGKCYFDPIYIGSIFYGNTPIGDWLESFFSTRFFNQDPNNKRLLYLKNEDLYSSDFTDYKTLYKACDDGDIQLLQEYFRLDSQWHIVNFEPIYDAIYANHFEIVDQLIAHGAKLKRWPNFLYQLLVDEFDLLCQGDCVNKDELPRTEALLYAIKSGAELNYYGCHYNYFTDRSNMETVLDYAQRIGFEPVVTALLEAGAKTVAELLQEQLYCPLPFDPATAQGIPFSD
jgi:hypothetical protein